jgi:hypothetical protein
LKEHLMKIRIAAVLLAFAAALSGAPVLAQTATPSKARVYLRDIEGIWMNEAYMKAVAQLRSPHAAAKKAPPLVIALKREGRAWPIVVTDFNKASMQAVLDVEPDAKPGQYRLVVGPDDRPLSSSEVTYIPFRGERNAQGRFDQLGIAEPTFLKGKWGSFVRLPGELSSSVNRMVIAGVYRDEKGRTWEFTEAGEARWPDQQFVYELSLNDPTATCEYLQTEDIREGADKKRYGYAWKSGKLSIFAARLAGKRVVCEAQPLAQLSPQ